MSTTDPADALQAGLYSRLSGDATLAALADVYDDVPEGVDMPYVVIGEMTSLRDGDHSAAGRETELVLHTWTRAQSSRPGNQIGARLVALLDRQASALDTLVSGHTVWMIGHEFAQTLRDPEPGVRHRVDRFRVWTRQEA